MRLASGLSNPRSLLLLLLLLLLLELLLLLLLLLIWQLSYYAIATG